jgi:hypothetical protein
VADQIRVAVCAFQLEVPVVGCQPRVEHFRNGDTPVTEDQRAWRLLAAMAGVALDANAEEAFFTQRRSSYDVEAQNRSRRRQIRAAAHEWPQAVIGPFWRLAGTIPGTVAHTCDESHPPASPDGCDPPQIARVLGYLTGCQSHTVRGLRDEVRHRPRLRDVDGMTALHLDNG